MGLPAVRRVGARIPPRIRFSGVNTHVRQGAGSAVRAASACDQVPQVHGSELSVSPGLRVREKEGPRSPVCILPVYEQSQAKGRGHRWHRSEDKNNPRDRLGSRLSRSRGRVNQGYADRPELSNKQLPWKQTAQDGYCVPRGTLTLCNAMCARICPSTFPRRSSTRGVWFLILLTRSISILICLWEIVPDRYFQELLVKVIQ